MMSQDVQTATVRVEVSQEQSREGMLVEAIARSALEDAIPSLPDATRTVSFANAKL